MIDKIGKKQINKNKKKKMWHTANALSATQPNHTTINAYQHYSAAQPQHQPNNSNTGFVKWNIAGQRSSYSLPHPGHTQSNMRWNKNDDESHMIASRTQPAHHFSNSTRDLSSTLMNGTFPYEQRPLLGSRGVGIQRQRPASMYDPPNSMPNISYQFHSSSFSPSILNQTKENIGKHHTKNTTTNIHQNTRDLVRFNSKLL